MAWSFRRSARLDPLRINFCKPGIGWSIGERGIRVGKDSKDRMYSQISIPGTGIYNRQYFQPPKLTAMSQPAQPPTALPPQPAPPVIANGQLKVQHLILGAGALLAVVFYLTRC